MKSITDLAVAYQPSNVSASPAPNGKTVSTFWTRMTELYGHRWTSAQGETPNPTWSKAISGLSNDELRKGLRACLNNANAWPPSLPEFMAMVRDRRENAAMYRNVPQLPAPKSSQETARRELQKLFLMVGRGSPHGL